MNFDKETLDVWDSLPYYHRGKIIRALLMHLKTSDPEHLRQDLNKQFGQENAEIIIQMLKGTVLLVPPPPHVNRVLANQVVAKA